MRIRSLFVTVFGVAIAGGSVFMAKEYLLDPNGAAIASTESALVQVIVAGTDIDFGQAIEAHVVTEQFWPREAVPAGSFLDYSDILASAGIDPRRAKGRIFKGEVLLASKLSEFGEKVTIVQKLSDNTRAMAIKVDAVTAVGGFVTPGDSVDIVLTQGRADAMRAVTILQSIRVIGVDQQSEVAIDQPEIARTITVEVTPEQGQRLALAQKAGTLSLTLRSLENVDDQPLEMIDLSDLLREKSPLAEADNSTSVKVRRGTAVETVEVN